MTDTGTSTTDERDALLIQVAMEAHRMHNTAGAFMGIKAAVLRSDMAKLTDALARLTQLGIIEPVREGNTLLTSVYVWRGFE